MHPDRQVALLRFVLQLFLLTFLGAASFYLSARAGFSGWKGLAFAWGIGALLLCFEQYRSTTRKLEREGP